MHKMLEGKEHLFRVAGLFLAGLVVFLVVQRLLVPSDFGIYGHYRAGALKDIKALPVVHAGQAACVACHSDEGALKQKGKHAKVSCEACHGPLGRHAAGESDEKPARPHGRTTCLFCHEKLQARPASHPQVDSKEHAGDSLCIECHSPHEPGSAPEAKSSPEVKS